MISVTEELAVDISTYRTEIATLIRTINKESEAGSEKTIGLCNQLESYGIARHDDALTGYACFVRGQYYYRKNDIIGFYKEMIGCMDPLENIGEWGYLAMANNMLGIMSLNRGNAPFALDYYYKAQSICEKYSLPDIEWVVQMNIGNLYLSIGSPDEAVRNYDAAYRYILAHKDMEQFRTSLTQAVVGLARAYMHSGDMDNAKKYESILEVQCMPYLTPENEIIVYSFLSRYYYNQGDKGRQQKAVKKTASSFSTDIALMDYFDDIYDFLSLLLETEDYRTFASLIASVSRMASKAAVRHMEQMLLELLLTFYQKIDDQDNYQKACVRYYEISTLMEQENQMMIKSMIRLRESFYRLTQINEEISEESKGYEKRSETDPLTGMYNRLKLNLYGDEAFERAVKNGTGLGVEMLDIDFFKEYNDNYGHQAGDRVIRFIADSIQTLQKDNHIFAARYGGDEFVLIYENYTAEEVFDLAKKLKDMINKAHVEHKYSRTASKFITVSQGAFWGIPEEGGSVWHYLHEADSLLYKVKQRTRNSVLVGQKPRYDSDDQDFRGELAVMEDENSDGL